MSRTKEDIARDQRFVNRQIKGQIEDMEELMGKATTRVSCQNLKMLQDQLRDSVEEIASLVKEESKLLVATPESSLENQEEALFGALYDLKSKCRKYTAKAEAVIIDFSQKRNRETLTAQHDFNGTVRESGILSKPNDTFLEKLKLHEFDGDHRTFLKFKTLFQSAIHEHPTLSKVKKLYYLQMYLKGEAAALVEDLPCTEESYDEAWGLICSRYDNKKTIAMLHFQDLFAIPNDIKEDNLRSSVDQVTRALKALKLCGEEPGNWESVIAYFVYSRLANRIKADFDVTYKEKQKFFAWKELYGFLDQRAVNNETRKIMENHSDRKRERPNYDQKRSFAIGKPDCVACDERHLLIECSVFKAKKPEERFEIIKRASLCANCFRPGHISFNCKSSITCKICSRKHHTLLHLDYAPSKKASLQVAAAQDQEAEKSNQEVSHTNLVATKKTILLPSAVVKVPTTSGLIEARILLDNCSQSTMVADDFVRKYKLKTFRAENLEPIKGVNGIPFTARYESRIKLKSRINAFEIVVVAEVVPSDAVAYQVRGAIISQKFQKFVSLPLADTAFYQEKLNIPKVDVLLGAEYYEAVILNETRAYEDIILRSTQFGWTITGNMRINESNFKSKFCNLTIQSVQSQLAEFMKIEEPPRAKRIEVEKPAEGGIEEVQLKRKGSGRFICPEGMDQNSFCIQHFEATHVRKINGQFQVSSPFVVDPEEVIVGNRREAVSNLLYTERKREKWRSQYNEFMAEYEELNHMSEVQDPNEKPAGYFIPHRAVIRPQSTTTSTRVVFNASSKTRSGYSLNDALATGPSIQPELFDTLVLFRTFKYAFCADITKMYRCILLDPSDRMFQHILWRPSDSESIKEYELNTVTYGTAPASFMATMCLEILAREVDQAKPSIAKAIRKGFYMDDLLWGAETLEAAMELRQEIHSVLIAAHFKLRKYQSNSVDFLNTIDPELVEKETDRYVKMGIAVAVLGMIWATTMDEFRIKIPENLKIVSSGNSKLTKRLMLSVLACVFDPLGLIAPVTIRGKLMLQQVWKEKKEWNDVVSPELGQEFVKYLQEIPRLEEFTVPRQYSDIYEDGKRRLFAFCDASERAYCIVFYLQVYLENRVTCSLVFSKTRVAPIKALTIPRLELQAALLLAESVGRVAQVLSISLAEVVAFSDSQVVLAWLQQPSKNWNTFVSSRVLRIVSLLPKDSWKYVSSKHNPADCGTRGLSVTSFIKSELWLNGPAFLSSWDPQNSDFRPPCSDTDQELRSPHTNLLPSFTGAIVKADFVEFIDRFSSFLKLIRTVSRILRLANRKAFDSMSLSAFELTRCELALIILIQKSTFGKEYEKLSLGMTVSSRSSLKSYLPFLDDDGVIRVRGRIQNSNLSFNKINPIILPARCSFVRLMIRHFHQLYYHANIQFLVNFLSEKYRFIGGLSKVVKSTLRSCVVCARFRKDAIQQVFGDLPGVRTVVNAPFSVTGVDFAGPFLCKPLITRSKVRFKVYAAIFVCFSTKATHIEIATALSAEAFLSTLQRFVARRGLPHTIWSDNGTNFQAAAKYLAAAAGSGERNLAFSDAKIADYAANRGINWRFNPPRAPHRGGLWEAAVKSAKYHMVRTIGEQVLDYERYVTLFASIESILNSRPLCANRSGSDTLSLTPAHFLIGRSMVELPTPELSSIKLSQRFEHVQRLSQSFWHVWKRDYLNQLQQRSKWHQPTPNLSIDDVVLLKNDLEPPTRWKLARVVETFPDRMGAVRTVKVVEAGNAVKCRDVRYLVRLPTEDQNS